MLFIFKSTLYSSETLRAINSREDEQPMNWGYYGEYVFALPARGSGTRNRRAQMKTYHSHATGTAKNKCGWFLFWGTQTEFIFSAHYPYPPPHPTPWAKKNCIRYGAVRLFAFVCMSEEEKKIPSTQVPHVRNRVCQVKNTRFVLFQMKPRWKYNDWSIIIIGEM